MRFSTVLFLSLLLAGVALPFAARAQEVVQPLPGTTEADKLADAVRRLGSNPRDLSSLIEAGELSVRLGDATAAAAFFKRAEMIDPANARVKAGIARILVNGEHPGEALRYFDQAQRYGLSPAAYADDRGLAYDLIGEQERAQRDYRVALANVDSDAESVDEVRRRYALSLGISGHKDEALAQIDALLRRSDRGAWRARAFILAMNGDAPGANRIATSMMPGGMATGLAAFFTRLPSLAPADRAFAVHFGEVSPTASRLADARMVPPLPALGPDPTAPRPAPVQVAANTAPAKPDRRREREAQRAQQAAEKAARDQARRAAAVAARAPAPVPATQVAANTVRPPLPAAVPTQLAANTLRASPPAAAVSPTNRPLVAPITPAITAQPATAVPAPGFAATAVLATTTPPLPSAVAAPITANPPSAAVANVASAPPVVAATPPATIAPSMAVAAAEPSRPTPPRMSEDSILARIVAGISIPASELGVEPPPRAPERPAATLDEAARAAERNAAADTPMPRRVAAVEPPPAARAPAKPDTRRPRVLAELADAKPRTGRAAATDEDEPRPRAGHTAAEDADADEPKPARKKPDAKLAAKEKAAAAAKALADKQAAEEKAAAKKAARTDPARYWVQVAGGATEANLDKAWKTARARSALLAGRKGYTTPLRATNRVVTGPFKTQDEAQALVNRLAKDGVSAFTFASTAGQKMTRLDGQ